MALIRNIVLSLAFMTFVSCVSINANVKKVYKCGQIRNTIKVFVADSNKFLIMPNIGETKILYRDSFVIQQIERIDIIDKEGEDELKNNVVLGYVLIDLANKAFYHFSSFSDTAGVIDAYKEEKIKEKKYGLWDFYKDTTLPAVDIANSINDTIIQGKMYRRFQSLWENRSLMTLYLDCSQKTMFQYFQSFSRKHGCPVVMVDLDDIGKKESITRFELEFDSDTLTAYQHKVFDIWEQYVKEHPLK